MTPEIAQQFALTALALAAPLLLAALGELIGERAGVLNIGLEGLMLGGAFAGAAASFYWHNAGIGILGAMLAGILLAALFALLVISWRADAIVAGTGINLLALGLTGVLHRRFIEKFGAYESVSLPQIVFIACGALFALFLWWALRRTKTGLQLRAVGEYPQAADTAGVNVIKMRWMATLCNGALVRLGRRVFVAVAHPFVCRKHDRRTRFYRAGDCDFWPLEPDWRHWRGAFIRRRRKRTIFAAIFGRFLLCAAVFGFALYCYATHFGGLCRKNARTGGVGANLRTMNEFTR